MRTLALLAFGHFGRHGGPLVLLLLMVAATVLAVVVLSSVDDKNKDQGNGVPPKIEK